MIRYFNLKSAYGTETVDELERKDFPTLKDFRNELRRLITEYNMAYNPSGLHVYISTRSTKEWRDRA
jgi:hypothetical protein